MASELRPGADVLRDEEDLGENGPGREGPSGDSGSGNDGGGGGDNRTAGLHVSFPSLAGVAKRRKSEYRPPPGRFGKAVAAQGSRPGASNAAPRYFICTL